MTALARTWEGSATRTVKQTVGKGDRERTRKRRVTRVESTAVQIVEMSRDDDQAAQAMPPPRPGTPAAPTPAPSWSPPAP